MMRSPRSLLLIAWVAAVTTGGPGRALAQEVSPPSNLRVSGFGTIGFVHADVTEPWLFQRDAAQPISAVYSGHNTRADTDSRVGVQLNYEIDRQFELVGQVQLKRRVQSSTAADSLESAFLAYRPTADVTVRIGRTSPDVFLLSDYRSVGFAYPWVRPNIETYGLLPIFSIDGADISKVWYWGDSRWRVKAFAGQGRTRFPSGPGNEDYDFQLRSVWGGMLSRESGGLLVRATAMQFHGGVVNNASLLSDPLRQGLAQIQALAIPQISDEARVLNEGLEPDTARVTYLALGASYEKGPWLLSAELVRLSSRLSLISVDTGYFSVGRRFGAFTAYGVVGAGQSHGKFVAPPQWQAALTPIVGPALAAQAQAIGEGAAYSHDSLLLQRSASIGLRWDVGPRTAVKFQFDRYWIRPHGSVLWTGFSDDNARANVTSLALDFVF